MVLALVGGAAATRRAAADSSAPRVRSLPIEPAGPTGPVADEPARRLPEVTTVCWDPAVPRCWAVAGESTCVTPSAPAARPFRIVIGGPSGDDATRALVECRAPPEP
jgi:hypothetical protein